MHAVHVHFLCICYEYAVHENMGMCCLSTCNNLEWPCWVFSAGIVDCTTQIGIQASLTYARTCNTLCYSLFLLKNCFSWLLPCCYIAWWSQEFPWKSSNKLYGAWLLLSLCMANRMMMMSSTSMDHHPEAPVNVHNVIF